ncbi:MAG TPA: ABC transporter ATP-binding protein [Thermodesulfovibrionales bacterium]|nr:ABC transporter ATP-binding protein [Thermodesulfovibrionales bacterium]
MNHNARCGGKNETAISLSDVSVKYRVIKEKRRTLQEYLINRLKGKRVNYEAFWALKDITLELNRGETIGIIGHNGAGKSTLLKVIAGVLKPTEGKVNVYGRIAPLIELGAGFDMELTGSENIYMNGSILGLSRREIGRKFDKIVAFSELEEFIYSPLRSYSSGMIARLGFSIATEVDPDILIIDEILAVGDEHFSKKCNERILNFIKRGTTIFLVSHNMTDIRRLCNNVLWLDHGLTRLRGNPDVVTNEYQKSIV